MSERQPDLSATIKRIGKSVFRATGLEVTRWKEPIPPLPGSPYAEVSPAATYSPWRVDGEFDRVHQLISGHTLVDHYRCYELWQLVAESAKLAGGDVIEIGVWRGGTGALIARQCQLTGINEPVYLCDTFKGVVKAGSRDAAYAGGEHADTNQAVVLQLLQSLQLDRVQILEGIFPDDTGHLVSDRTFRLCHIDVDVYESAKDILHWVWPRLVHGGIVVFDDYGFDTCTGITRFVNEERAKTDRLVIHNLNGHAVLIKLTQAVAGRTLASGMV